MRAIEPVAQLPTFTLLAQDCEDNTNTAGSADARVSPERRTDNFVYEHLPEPNLPPVTALGVQSSWAN
jgi:hypothetical protein